MVSARLAAARGQLNTPLFRNAYALIVNTGITSLLGFAYWVVAARLFSARDVGLAAAAISAMALLAGIALFNLEAVLIRFIPIAGRHTRVLVGAVYLGCMAAAVLVTAIFIAGLQRWDPALGFLAEHGGGAWFVAATVAWVLFIMHDGILVGLGGAVWVPVENTIFGVGKLALLILFAGGGALGLFASWSIAAALVVIPFTALIFLRLIPRHMEREVAAGEALTWRTVRHYAAGDYVGSVFELATISLLPLLVTRLAGPVENAYFYQSWIIAYTLIMVATATAQALTVEAAKEQGQLQAYGRAVIRHTLKLLAPAVAGIMLLAPLILRVFGPDYAEGGALALRILALAALPHTVVLLALVTARLQQRMREVIAIQAAIAVIALGTCLALAGEYGGTGAAIGWLAGQSLVAFVLLATRLQWLYRPGAAALVDAN